MITGIGTDIVEISRVKRLIENTKFLSRYFSGEEIAFFNGIHPDGNKTQPEASQIKQPSVGKRAQSVAANFAAKEAFVKALGTGFRALEIKDIEIIREKSGKPVIIENETIQRLKKIHQFDTIHITLSHSRQLASATVILERDDRKGSCN